MQARQFDHLMDPDYKGEIKAMMIRNLKIPDELSHLEEKYLDKITPKEVAENETVMSPEMVSTVKRFVAKCKAKNIKPRQIRRKVMSKFNIKVVPNY